METDFTKEELYKMAQKAEINGRSDMDKAELMENLGLVDPFKDVWHCEEGDVVEMNHLKGFLNITEINRDEDQNKAQITMVTSRGGRHKLLIKGDRTPILRRWRAGDKEWMNNSTTPTYFKVLDLE